MEVLKDVGKLGQKFVFVIERPSDGSQRMNVIECGHDELIRNIYIESFNEAKGARIPLFGDHFGNFEQNCVEKADKGCQTFDVEILEEVLVNRELDTECLDVYSPITPDAVDNIELHHHINYGSLATSDDLLYGFLEVGAEIEVIDEISVLTESVDTHEPEKSAFPAQLGRHGLDLSGVDVTASRAVRSKTEVSHPGLRKNEL